MDMFREISSLILLLFDEISQNNHVSVKYGSELLSSDHLHKSCLVSFGYLRRLFEILEVLVLTFKVVPQILHIFQTDDAFEKACWLQMLPSRIDMQADLFFHTQHFCQHILRLAHVLDTLHHEAGVRPLFRHKSYDKHRVDPVADLELVQLGVEGLQVLAHRKEQVHQLR